MMLLGFPLLIVRSSLVHVLHVSWWIQWVVATFLVNYTITSAEITNFAVLPIRELLDNVLCYRTQPIINTLSVRNHPPTTFWCMIVDMCCVFNWCERQAYSCSRWDWLFVVQSSGGTDTNVSLSTDIRLRFQKCSLYNNTHRHFALTLTLRKDSYMWSSPDRRHDNSCYFRCLSLQLFIDDIDVSQLSVSAWNSLHQLWRHHRSPSTLPDARHLSYAVWLSTKERVVEEFVGHQSGVIFKKQICTCLDIKASKPALFTCLCRVYIRASMFMQVFFYILLQGHLADLPFEQAWPAPVSSHCDAMKRVVSARLANEWMPFFICLKSGKIKTQPSEYTKRHLVPYRSRNLNRLVS